jgi:excisionase family DNA binding protein
MDKKLGYSVEECAAAIGLGRTSMFELVASRQIESVKIGRRRIIPIDALERFIMKLRAEQAELTAPTPAADRQDVSD